MSDKSMTGLTISQNKKFLIGTFKSGDYETVIYLEGHHGIGKTDIAWQAAREVFQTEAQKSMSDYDLMNMSDEERGWVFIREYPATKNVEDYTGVPHYDAATGFTIWGTPHFFPTKGRGVMVIEELNQATEDVLKAMFPLLQDKKIGSHKLSPEVYLVVTGNPPNSVHRVVEFPVALKDRMQRMGVVHSAPDWLKWARAAGEKIVHPACISYIEDSPTMLHVISDDGEQGPTPRAWVAVGRQLMKFEKGLIEEYMLIEAIKNRVGGKAATAFFGHYRNKFKRAVTAEELLTKYEEFLPRFKAQSAAGKTDSIDSVMQWIEANVGTLSKDSAELGVIEDLFTKNTPDAVLVAKAMGITPETLNKLAALGQSGIKIGHKLAAIRFQATQPKQS